MPHIQISEIFTSIQGESTLAGWPTTFVRTTGCPVRCSYCDTEYAFHGGTRMSYDDILAEIKTPDVQTVCVTGGEPLAQSTTIGLLQVLVDSGYAVSLETSGVRSIRDVPRPCKIVLDLKTPGSSVDIDWLPDNLGYLQTGDELKTVITSESDWYWWTDWVAKNRPRLPDDIELLVSPCAPGVPAAKLAQWLIESSTKARLNMQLHKLIWPEENRGR